MDEFNPPQGTVEYKEHTADLWLQASGGKVEGVITDLINGIYRVIASSFITDEKKGKLKLKVQGPDVETAMVDLLNEILFHFDAESIAIMVDKIEVRDWSDGIEITAEGDAFIVSIPEGKGGMEVKAATYHGAKISSIKDGVLGRVLLDL